MLPVETLLMKSSPLFAYLIFFDSFKWQKAINAFAAGDGGPVIHAENEGTEGI